MTEDIVKEYIMAIRYHIDNDCLNLKEGIYTKGISL